MIDHVHRLIFVHIQKTGGNSIAAAMGRNPDCPEKHFLAKDLRVLYGPGIWDAYFKFAFVRNPWDRLVSWWSMIDANRAALAEGQPLNKFHRFIFEKATTFEEFLENCDEEIFDSDGCKWIYRNQSDYLTDASRRQIVDYVGRFETIQQDFDRIARKVVGHSLPLARVNRSQHRHYTEYYSPTLAEMVGRRFERDIKAFGYAFGQ